MPAERPRRHSTGKPAPGGDGAAAPRPGTEQLAPKARYVDIDPWAALLEGLMVPPEEVPAGSKRPKGK